MNCSEFRTELSLFIQSGGDSITERNRLQNHAEFCGDRACRRLWANEELFAECLPGWRQAVPEVDLAEQVVSQLRHLQESGGELATHSLLRNSQPSATSVSAVREPSSLSLDRSAGTAVTHVLQQSSRFSPTIDKICTNGAPAPHPGVSRPDRPVRIWVAGAVSVAALLLLLPLLRTANQRPDALASRLQLTSTDTAIAVDPETDDPQEPEAVAAAFRTYADVPQAATEFVTDAIVLLLPGDLSESGEDEPSRPARWRGRLSEQLEPWSRELGTAFDALLESVSEPQDSSQYEPVTSRSGGLAV